jgi:hypothetical protein
MFNLHTRAKLRPNANEAEANRAVLEQRLRLIFERGEKVWPKEYAHVAGGYVFLGDFDKAYEAIERTAIRA